MRKNSYVLFQFKAKLRLFDGGKTSEDTSNVTLKQNETILEELELVKVISTRDGSLRSKKSNFCGFSREREKKNYVLICNGSVKRNAISSSSTNKF